MSMFLSEYGKANIITPDCDRTDCVVQEGGSMSTCIGWTPTYDKFGNLLNSDPNKTTSMMSCITCGKNWVRVI